MSRKPVRLMDKYRQEFKQWLATPEIDRNPSTLFEFAKKLGIHPRTLGGWKKTFVKQGVKPLPQLQDLTLEQKDKLVDDLLFQLANDPESPAKYKELYLRSRGKLIDKIETKRRFELSADDIIRRNLEANQELDEWRKQLNTGGQRVPQMPE